MEVVKIYKTSTVRPIVKAILKYKKSGTVLDLGSGPGRHTLFLAKKGFAVTAIEISREKSDRLKKAAHKENLSVRVVTKNIVDLDIAKSYDIVLATMSLHFLSKTQVPKAVHFMQ